MEMETEYWDFIAKYLPDYYTNDQVLKSDILWRYVGNEEVDDDDIEWILSDFSNKDEIYEEIANVESQLFSEAMHEYCKQMAKRNHFGNQRLLSYLTPVSKIPIGDNVLNTLQVSDTDSSFLFVEKEYENYASAQLEIGHIKYEKGLKYVVEQEGNTETTHVLYHISKSNDILDGTNFMFQLTGNMTDEIMSRLNDLHEKSENEEEGHPTITLLKYLREQGIGIEFMGTAEPIANENLVRCGGLEMPKIIGCMLEHFYYDNCFSPTTINDCIDYLSEHDIAGYGFDNRRDTYRSKLATLLYATFTGLRLDSSWNGRTALSGAYVVVKSNGEVAAFSSAIVDDFKDFLVSKLALEVPASKSNLPIAVERTNGKYYLKLALSFRFDLSGGNK